MAPCCQREPSLSAWVEQARWWCRELSGADAIGGTALPWTPETHKLRNAADGQTARHSDCPPGSRATPQE